MRICGDQGDPLRFCRSYHLTSETIIRPLEASWGIMDAMRKDQQGEVVSNIPHMRLFMELKRQFPLLKDADITDCIQRFGLDRLRCEDELNRRIQDQHRGYYSPWNQSRAESLSSSASRNSPLSPPETPSHSSPLQNGSASSTPVILSPQVSHHTHFAINSSSSDLEEEEEEQEEVSIIKSYSNPLANSNPSAMQVGEINSVYSSAADTNVSTTPSYYQPALHRKFALPVSNNNNNGVCIASNGYISQNVIPNSAPVISSEEQPFLYQPVNNRRRSVESAVERRKRILASKNLLDVSLYESSNNVQNESSHESNQENPIKTSIASPPSPTNTTTSPPSNASPPVTTQTSYSSSYMNDQCPQQQSPVAIQEQISRKNKLREELHRRLDEKVKLEEQVKNLAEELETRERIKKQDEITSRKKMELIQQENSRLQFICDEMEREILESGESPKTDQEGRILSSRLPSTPTDLPASPFQESPLRPPQSLARASSASSLSSGVGTPTTPILPSRRAPSPPFSANTMTGHGSSNLGHGGTGQISSQQVERRPTNVAATEDGGKEWSCSKCTFINSPFLNECEICGFPHFPIGTPPSLSQQPPSATPSPGGPCYCHHRHYNLNHEHHSTVRDI